MPVKNDLPNEKNDDTFKNPEGWEYNPEEWQQDEIEENILELSRLPNPILKMFRWWNKNSSSAKKNWLAYYEGLYNKKSPDVKVFKKLLSTYGFHHYKTPFPPGSVGFFDYCQQGITLSDVVFLIERWMSLVMDMGVDFYQTDLSYKDDKVNPYIDDNNQYISRFSIYDTLENHLHMQRKAFELQQRDYAIKASSCLIALFVETISLGGFLS